MRRVFYNSSRDLQGHVLTASRIWDWRGWNFMTLQVINGQSSRRVNSAILGGNQHSAENTNAEHVIGTQISLAHAVPIVN
jgi:hypothetical protein